MSLPRSEKQQAQLDKAKTATSTVEDDPVFLMRRLYSQDKMDSITETDDDIAIGDRTWPKDGKTRFRRSGFPSDDNTPANFYTLSEMYNFMKSCFVFQRSDRSIIFNFLEHNHLSQPDKLFDTLPDEIVTKILSYLPINVLGCRVSLVSRRLRKISLTPSLWKQIILTEKMRAHLHSAERLFLRCSLLETLDLRSHIHSAALATVALRSCPRLKSLLILTLGGKVEDVDGLIRAIGMSPSVRTLQLEYIPDCRLLVDHAGSLRNLTDIRLGVWDTGSGLLGAIGRHCKGLKSLSCRDRSDFLYNVRPALTSLTFSNLEDAAFTGIQHCEALTNLSIRSCGFRGGALEDICQLPKLKSLTLVCNHLDYRRVIAVFTRHRMTELTELRVDGGLDDDGLIAFADGCPGLRSLALSCYWMGNWGIRHVLRSCMELRELRLSGAVRITPASFDIAPPGLEVLVIKGSGWSTTKFKEVRRKLPHLKELSDY